jgi:uncharacterized membrane protein YkvA (DUF1232 family)
VWQRWKAWAGRLKRDIVALWIAARDPRVPLGAKLLAAAVAAYAFSPIDLIPDFIPVLGLLDDLLLLPVGIAIALRLVPPPLMAEFRERAANLPRPRSLAGLLAILLIWVTALLICYKYL